MSFHAILVDAEGYTETDIPTEGPIAMGVPESIELEDGRHYHIERETLVFRHIPDTVKNLRLDKPPEWR